MDRQTQQLGSTIDDVISILGSLPPIVFEIIEDPAFPEVVSLIKEVVDLQTAKSGGTSTGVHLSSWITPLKAYVFYRKNPWAPYAAGAVVLAVPFLLGMVIGKKVGRKRARAS